MQVAKVQDCATATRSSSATHRNGSMLSALSMSNTTLYFSVQLVSLAAIHLNTEPETYSRLSDWAHGH